MWLIRECFGAEKISWKNEQKFIFQFLLKIEIGIWNSFFDLIMKTKNEKNSKLFHFKTKIECPFRLTYFSSSDKLETYNIKIESAFNFFLPSHEGVGLRTFTVSNFWEKISGKKWELSLLKNNHYVGPN